MATEKQFTVVGVSSLDGEYKVRFANDIMRIKVLAKKGHIDIRLAELDEPMGKYEAVMAIKDLESYQDNDAKFCIDTWLDANRPKTAKVKAEVKEEVSDVEENEDDNVPF